MSFGNENVVLCPFYRGNDGRHCISCEGFVDESIITQRYRLRQERVQQMEIFCKDRYTYCEVYRMLMREKYGEE